MLVGSPLPKEPGERIPWSVDFKNVIVSPATISGTPVFKATDDADNSDVTGTLQQGTVVVAGTVVTVDVKAGTHGKNYTLELKATDSNGRIWEAEQQLIVRDIPAPL
jgi:hypothetical protein